MGIFTAASGEERRVSMGICYHTDGQEPRRSHPVTEADGIAGCPGLSSFGARWPVRVRRVSGIGSQAALTALSSAALEPQEDPGTGGMG